MSVVCKLACAAILPAVICACSAPAVDPVPPPPTANVTHVDLPRAADSAPSVPARSPISNSRSEADCKSSPGCIEDGFCFFRDGGCSLLPPECDFDASCMEKANQNCARTEGCRSDGRCIYTVATGCTVDPDGCSRSNVCRAQGACTATPGREDKGCIADDAGCKRSAVCAAEGRCSVEVVGIGNFAYSQCVR